ncbi:hypothetical protein [Pararhizobium qamdonense]|uniref:hypothetical protein n=1 Tax=Pararhizobium qamdonense TaxID=3031126 RepID=UPI0023E0EEDB|nr:hypothetical protein [Pararhizobium qamdonense]
MVWSWDIPGDGAGRLNGNGHVSGADENAGASGKDRTKSAAPKRFQNGNRITGVEAKPAKRAGESRRQAGRSDLASFDSADICTGRAYTKDRDRLVTAGHVWFG